MRGRREGNSAEGYVNAGDAAEADGKMAEYYQDQREQIMAMLVTQA